MSTSNTLMAKGAVMLILGALNKQVLIYIICFILLIIAILLSVWAYTEVLWYEAIGYLDVLLTLFKTMFWMGMFPLVLMTLFVGANMTLARKLAPADRVVSSDETRIDRWRRALSPFWKALTVSIALFCGLFIALQTHVHWDTYLLWSNGESWGRVDPQFGRDLSYFMFDLPFYTLVNRWAFIGLLVVILLTAITSYLFGGLRPQAPGAKIPGLVNIHFSLLLLMLIVMLGWGLILELHLLSYSERGVITGLGFTDANASLVAYKFVATGVVTGFVLFQINIRKPGWILPTIALIWLFLIGLAAARFYPKIYQLLIVEPQELERESSFIEKHLEFTRYGFGLDHVTRRTTPGNAAMTTETLEAYRGTLDRIRLWDPETLQINFEELQSLRTYYEFPDVDVDRYEIDGEVRPVMIAAREVNVSRLPDHSRRWQAQKMIYTHGHGLVSADVSRATEAGMPHFLTRDLPTTGLEEIAVANPFIYYGERSPDYSFVDTDTLELKRPIDPTSQPSSGPDGQRAPDRPNQSSGNQRDCPTNFIDDPSQSNTLFDMARPAGTGADASPEECPRDQVGFLFNNYSGDGGIVMRHLLHRFAFAIRFWDLRLALTLLLDTDNKVMMHREVRDRVQRLVPYLQVDRNPYPVAVDGRIHWIVDVYTVSDMMPYSRRVNLTDLTQVTQPKQGGSTLIPEEFIRSEAGLSGTANYIRGSVRAVVDAYHGSVDFYVVDPEDEVLKVWQKVFPDTFKPMEEASEGLRRHFRYPHDLFRVQAVIWSDYHMETPEAFYSREAAWRIPPDAAFISDRREREEPNHEGRRADMRPYWMHMQLPGEEDEQFVIVQPFSPDRRNVLTGYLAGFSDGDRMGDLVSYAFPPTTTVLGPSQAQARIDQDVRISAWMTLRMQSGSRVSRGKLLTLPLGDAVIYVQPLFVQADKSSVSQLLGAQLSSLPELKKVVIVHGDRVVMRNTMDEALEALVSGTDPAPGPTPASTASSNEEAARQDAPRAADG